MLVSGTACSDVLLATLPATYRAWLAIALALPRFDPHLFASLVGIADPQRLLEDWRGLKLIEGEPPNVSGLVRESGAALSLGGVDPRLIETAWRWYVDQGELALANELAVAHERWDLVEDDLSLPRECCRLDLSSLDRSRITKHYHETTLRPRLLIPAIEVRLLGYSSLIIDGRAVKIPQRGYTLLALLVLAGPAGIDCDELAEAIWGSEPCQAGQRKLLERVRKVLPPRSITLRDNRYRLDLPNLKADVLTVLHSSLVMDYTDLVDVAKLAARPLLPGNTSPLVQQWRARLLHCNWELWLRIGDLEFEAGNLFQALQSYRRVLAVNPLVERAVLRVMELLVNDDDRVEAMTVYHLYKDELSLKQGVLPTRKIEDLFIQILRQDD